MNLEELEKVLTDEYGSGSVELLRPSKGMERDWGLICEKARLLLLDGHLISYDDVISTYLSEEKEFNGCGSTKKKETIIADLNGRFKKSETSAGPAYDYDDVDYWYYVELKYKRDGKEESWAYSMDWLPNELYGLAYDVAERAFKKLGHISITKERDGSKESWDEECFDEDVKTYLQTGWSPKRQRKEMEKIKEMLAKLDEINAELEKEIEESKGLGLSGESNTEI